MSEYIPKSNIREHANEPKTKRQRFGIGGVVLVVLTLFGAFLFLVSKDSQASDRESSLQEKYPQRTQYLADYLAVMGFSTTQPVNITFGKPMVGTSGDVKNSGLLILGTGSQSSSTHLSAQEYFPVTMIIGGTGYHFLVSSVMVTTRADTSTTHITLANPIESYAQDTVSCTSPFFHPSRVRCSVAKMPNIDPQILGNLKQQGLATLIENNLSGISSPSSAIAQ
ncbi:MAG: hypothetical protein ACHQUB_01960 [Candidatus Saccharimonadia bacterium]